MNNQRYKGLLITISVVCVLSIFINIVNAKHSEHMRQMYVHSIINHFINLEILSSNIYHSLDNSGNVSKTISWEEFEVTLVLLDNDLNWLTQHHNGKWHVVNMSLLRRHVTELLFQASEGNADLAVDFFNYLNVELSEIVQELSYEGDAQWLKAPDMSISSRQLFGLINAFMQDINEEIRRSIHKI